MSDSQHDHDRPGIADMRAALAVTRASSTPTWRPPTRPPAPGPGARSVSRVAGISFGITLASAAAGDTAAHVRAGAPGARSPWSTPPSASCDAAPN